MCGRRLLIAVWALGAVLGGACKDGSSQGLAVAKSGSFDDAGPMGRDSGGDAATAPDVADGGNDASCVAIDGMPIDAIVDTGAGAPATPDARTDTPGTPDTRADKPDAPPPLPELACGVPEEIVRVTDFDTKYPRCTHLRGGLHLPDAFDRDVLRHVQTLRRIDGRFTVFRSHALSDLRGLERLEHIGGELSLASNSLGGLADTANLTSLDGLSSLAETGGLLLDFNGYLRDLSGLSALSVVRGDVVIRNNRALPRAEIDALLARIRVSGTVTVSGNGP